MEVAAALVNHNTSDYAELALRSLLARNVDFPAAVSLLDNASSEGVEELFAFCATSGITVTQSGRTLETGRNTHGEILARFMLERRDADAFLLLDADICFLEDETLRSMVDQLAARPDAWAVQAKMLLFAELLRPGWTPRPTRPMFWRYAVKWGEDFGRDEAEGTVRSAASHQGVFQGRPHPFCLLVRNSPTLMRVLEAVGFSTAFVNADLPCGGWYDTGALAARVLASHQLSWFVSDQRPVLHYANVAERRETPELMKTKRDDCRKRLAAYRSGGADAS